MLAQKVGTAILPTAPNDTNISITNNTTRHTTQSSEKSPNNTNRQEQIAKRRTQIPKLYRGTYDKAIRGKSRKSATRSFCLECCGWQIKEVYLCTDLACPLYPYRPRSRVSPVAPESVPNEPESKKLVQPE